MSDEQNEEQPASTGLTARVADSYGVNPHEHKPSQDPWNPDDADEKQADTGDSVRVVVVEKGGEEPSPGNSSSTSETGSESSPEKTEQGSTPAPSAENRSAPGRKVSSTARSTATKPLGQSGRKAD